MINEQLASNEANIQETTTKDHDHLKANQEKGHNEVHPIKDSHGSSGGEVAQNEVFPYLLSGLGDHREFSIFNYKLFELPVIIYDSEDGINLYSSMHKMEESGSFTMHHGHPPIVSTKDHQPVTLDLSITSLMVYQWIAMLVGIVVFYIASRRYKTHPSSAPRGIQNLIESTIVFIRDEIIGPVLANSKVTNRLLPYFSALFFFILIINALGLLPGAHTATGAIGTTAALAITAFIVVNFTAIKESGIGAWFKHLLGGAPWPLAFIMVPIEIISLFVKPFALTIRLFANMTAGHVVLLSLVGLIFYFKSIYVAPISVAFSIFMYFLEVLVAFLQAYVFTILTAVFTGLAIGHHEHEHESEHIHEHAH